MHYQVHVYSTCYGLIRIDCKTSLKAKSVAEEWRKLLWRGTIYKVEVLKLKS